MQLRTVTEAAKELNITRGTIYYAVRNKQLKVLRLGNRMCVDLDAAREILISSEP